MKFSKIRSIPRPVFILGFVSFFNDLSSEMIYPIVPIFLTSVLGTPIPIVGLIEGTAEATAAITKFLFGAYSDYIQRRKPFVIGGYSLGAASKLLIGLASIWPLVLFARFIDRLGKGMRTAARDSLLLDNSNPKNKGFIFGFHRAFDSLGAVFGPLLALLLLVLLKDNIRLTFFIAFIPAVIAVFLLFIFVKETAKPKTERKFHLKNLKWNLLDARLKLFLIISFIFSAGNSSDAFLLLRAKNLGLTTTLVVLTYVLYNIAQTAFATPLGQLSDKIGPKKVFSGGLLVFAAVYLLFGLIKTPNFIWFLFPIYGIYIAATDGVSKAYVAEFIKKEESGTFFGAYYTLTAIGTFLASFVGGILWSTVNPSATFLFGAGMALLAFIIFTFSQTKIQQK
ncbi:MAG TPA: MFS transporter [Candidatus Saccharimonadales bacterium]|nr:MFS transporter [Candidatus Saccharimonadales bacterium]